MVAPTLGRRKQRYNACTVDGAACKCAECPKCHMLFVLKPESAWIGKQPAKSGNEHRLFCICGELSFFDPTKLKRYVVSAEIYTRGYGSPIEMLPWER
jgi:hypothetical protein